MNIKLCDRCGSKIYASAKHPTRNRIHGGYITGIAYYCDCDCAGGVDTVADLCDNCLDDYNESKQRLNIEKE